MTNTYTTGNPLGSTDPRDLLDNASNLDDGMNSALPTFTDRLGVSRDTWAGMQNTFALAQSGREAAFTLSQADKESRFQAFLVSSGYVSKGDYAANVVLAERNEYVAVNAATTGTSPGLYRPNASATLPLTLTGTWATDAANLVLLGDDVLRQELAAPGGAMLVGNVGIVFDSVADMQAATWLNVGDSVSVAGYTSPTDGLGHKRVISASNDGSGVAVGSLWANVIPDSGGVDVKWLGPEVTPHQIRTMLQSGSVFKQNIKLTSLSHAYSSWVARLEYPIAFFGDSTTDGATTTGHVPSIPTPTGVQINESPNAYCKILEDTIKRAIPSYPAGHRVIYNAGFDSQSILNSFAIDKFDSIFIGSEAPFVDAKMIGFAWGVTDVINSDNPLDALSRYRLNMEALVLYSLAKGRQPFLASPVPMWVTGEYDRNGWQLLSWIDEANSAIASRYNLDIISLREAIELDTEVNGNPLTYFAPDKIHPNNLGHSAIAGGLFAQLCPNVFTDRDSIVCGSPNIMRDSYGSAVVDKGSIPVKYDYFFIGGVYKFFAYLKEPKILTVDSFNLGEGHILNPTALVNLNTYNDKSNFTRNVFSNSLDFYSETFGFLVDSKEFVAKLPVGLTEVTLTVNEGRMLGSLQFSDDDYMSIEYVAPVSQQITQKYRNLETYSKGLPTPDSDFDQSQYYLCKGTSEFSIECVAFNALNSAICFNVSSDRMRYNYLKLLPDRVEWWVVVGGVHTKQAEALKDPGFDTASMINAAARLRIDIASAVDSTSSADTVTFKVDGITAYSNLVSTSQTLLNIKQGWGIGLFDLEINGLRKSLSDITVISNK